MLKSQIWDGGDPDSEDTKQLEGVGNHVSFPFHHVGRPQEESLVVPTRLEMCWQISDCCLRASNLES